MEKGLGKGLERNFCNFCPNFEFGELRVWVKAKDALIKAHR